MSERDKFPNEYLSAIGTVVVEWNLLEAWINNLLILLIEFSPIDPKPYILFAHVGFTQKIQTLGSLIDYGLKTKTISEDSHLGMYRKNARPLLEIAQTQRNQVIHDMWAVEDGGTVSRTSISARGSLKIKRNPTPTASEIDDSATVIHSAADAIMALVEEWNTNKGSASRTIVKDAV